MEKRWLRSAPIAKSKILSKINILFKNITNFQKLLLILYSKFKAKLRRGTNQLAKQITYRIETSWNIYRWHRDKWHLLHTCYGHGMSKQPFKTSLASHQRCFSYQPCHHLHLRSINLCILTHQRCFHHPMCPNNVRWGLKPIWTTYAHWKFCNWAHCVPFDTMQN